MFVCPLLRVFDFRSVPSMGRKFYHWRNWVLVSIILPIVSLRRQSMQNKHGHISESTIVQRKRQHAVHRLRWSFEGKRFERLVVWRHRATARLFCNLAFRLDGPSKYYDTRYDWENLLATFKRICKEARWLMSWCHHCPQTAQLFSMFPNMHVFLFQIITVSLRKLLCNWQIISRLQMCAHSG